MAKLKGMASTLSKEAGSAKDPADGARLKALGDILEHPAM
jgi:hypothetical protein